jgi:hypothetical protein
MSCGLPLAMALAFLAVPPSTPAQQKPAIGMLHPYVSLYSDTFSLEVLEGGQRFVALRDPGTKDNQPPLPDGRDEKTVLQPVPGSWHGRASQVRRAAPGT